MFKTNLLVLFDWVGHRQQMRGKVLQQESAEQHDATQVDVVAKKQAVMSELASVVSACQVLERDIERLRKEIVTAGMC